MSTARTKRHPTLKDRAAVFAALGDVTRLSLVAVLANGPPQSIARLADSSTLTRQAITKHLRVLEEAGVVHGVRAGRESIFALRPESIQELQTYLESVSAQWDDALLRLKSFLGE